MKQRDVDAAIKIVRDGLLDRIQHAEPRQLIRIARLIESMEGGASDDRLPSLLELLQREAARRR